MERQKAKNKISIRNGFSDRNNIKSENKVQQLEDFDERTRVSLTNLLNNCIHGVYGHRIQDDKYQSFIRNIRSNVYTKINDYGTLYSLNDVIEMLTDSIMNDDYDAVLSVIEFVCQALSRDAKNKAVFYLFNCTFEEEYVGYRFVNEQITPITNKKEIETIENAINGSSNDVSEHFDKALKLLSDREFPDYENSIKESISAVEAECNIILGKHDTLSSALNSFEKQGIIIHPALRQAFEKLYGYTGDGKGIRHAGNLGSPNSTFEEAEFMLVACSAFVNYLLSINAKLKKK